MRTKALFPDMEREIREDLKASKREETQRARDWLAKRDIVWLINYLLEKGPMTEHAIYLSAIEEKGDSHDEWKLLFDLISLWQIRKLWRKSNGIHPGSGEESFLYGIRGVHAIPLAP